MFFSDYRLLFPQSILHQITDVTHTISDYISQSWNTNNNNNIAIQNIADVKSDDSSTLIQNISSFVHKMQSNSPSIKNDLFLFIPDLEKRFSSSIILLLLYLLSTFLNPEWMVQSAQLRKSLPKEISKHPKVVVSPNTCPSILLSFISLSSCIFQYSFVINDDVLQMQNNRYLSRLSFIIYSRLTEISACLIVLYSDDFVNDPLIAYAHKEGNRIVWKQKRVQPIISVLFEIWSDFLQNIGRSLMNYHSVDDHSVENPITNDNIFMIQILLDIFLRCIIFQNQMELHFTQSVFYLRLMKV